VKNREGWEAETAKRNERKGKERDGVGEGVPFFPHMMLATLRPTATTVLYDFGKSQENRSVNHRTARRRKIASGPFPACP
jgi:hypothetical protein